MDRLYNIFPKTADERIHANVCRLLVSQTDIEPQEIVVEVKNSAVILTGRVENCLEKQEAERAAKAAHGVSSVINEIRIEPKRPRADREIEDNVLASLRTTMCIREERPLVTVYKGIVTLRGQARWKFQAVSAERAAEAVVGVRLVRNLIESPPFETFRPCRQANRGRLNDTPSSMNCAELKLASDCRPLFFVPSAIGRA